MSLKNLWDVLKKNCTVVRMFPITIRRKMYATLEGNKYHIAKAHQIWKISVWMSVGQFFRHLLYMNVFWGVLFPC